MTHNLKFETQGHALPPNARQAFSDAEKAFATDDRKFLDLKEARNDLESFCYQFRSNIGEYGSWEKNVSPDVRGPFLAQLNETVEWLYAEGENAPLAEYQERQTKFSAIGVPIRTRAQFYSTIEDEFKIFNKGVAFTNEKLASMQPRLD